jgi:hypothetical protein
MARDLAKTVLELSATRFVVQPLLQLPHAHDAMNSSLIALRPAAAAAAAANARDSNVLGARIAEHLASQQDATDVDIPFEDGFSAYVLQKVRSTGGDDTRDLGIVHVTFLLGGSSSNATHTAHLALLSYLMRKPCLDYLQTDAATSVAFDVACFASVELGVATFNVRVRGDRHSARVMDERIERFLSSEFNATLLALSDAEFVRTQNSVALVRRRHHRVGLVDTSAFFWRQVTSRRYAFGDSADFDAFVDALHACTRDSLYAFYHALVLDVRTRRRFSIEYFDASTIAANLTAPVLSSVEPAGGDNDAAADDDGDDATALPLSANDGDDNDDNGDNGGDLSSPLDPQQQLLLLLGDGVATPRERLVLFKQSMPRFPAVQVPRRFVLLD